MPSTGPRDTEYVTIHVLYVCTGNVCRSPMAEWLLRSRLPADADVTVESAGMAALVGHEIDYGSASVLAELGIDASAHRARQFEPAMAAGADLVLTAERAHRDLVLTQVPTALRRTFTMKEFARVVPHADGDTPAEVIAAVAAARGMFGQVPLPADDVPDPYRGGVSRAKEIAEQISATVRVTLTALGLSTAAGATAPDQAADDAARVPATPRPEASS